MEGIKRPERGKQLLLITHSSLERGNAAHDSITVEQYCYTISINIQKSFTALAFQSLLLLLYKVRNPASATWEIFLIREDTQMYT